MKALKNFLSVLIFIIACPVSWFAAWSAGSIITVAFSLGIPTYGLVYWILVQIIGHSLIQSILSMVLGFIGCAIAVTLIGYLSKNQSGINEAKLDPELKECIRELDKIEENYGVIFFKDVKSKVKEILLKEKEKSLYSLREEGWPPNRLVLLLISNVTGELISSSQYHVYRGCLNMVGCEYLKFFNKAVSDMEKYGYISTEEAEDDRKWIKEQIEMWG